MNTILPKIAPVILVFAVGYLLKRGRVLSQLSGEILLKLVFYGTLPPLIVLSLARTRLTAELFFLPLIAAAIDIILAGMAFGAARRLKLPPARFGVLMVGAMIMNVGFVLPFVLAAYGQDGLARLVLFDFGNGLVTFTLAYYLACKYGANDQAPKLLVKKFVLSPPIWALAAALGLNLTGASAPVWLDGLRGPLATVTTGLIMLALGIYFNPRIVGKVAVGTGIGLRVVGGLAMGLMLSQLFGLEGTTRAVVLIAAAAPIGYNTLTFSALESLDKEFAASLVSLSVLIGLVAMPGLILLLS
ncbi:MAG TPA: AEC family transporter [Candidatus Saccharimonadales bacterium]|nr:AEC family transporter [Candidatus Saccharimonadales bacterium]